MDPAGGFRDALDLDLKPEGKERKSLLVTARQIYVFSHAYLLGGPEWMLATARHGLAFLRRAFWDARHGGWIRSVTASGEPLDRRKDTYDHAFVLFAMAYFRRATNEKEPLDLASRTLDLLEEKLADRTHGGFREGAEENWEVREGLRRQNPHMHLLEAFLALGEATGEARWRAQADRIVELFLERFFDPGAGCLMEFFTRDWRRDPGERGAVVEPGHNYEWVWLLHQYARIARRADVLEPAGRMFEFASGPGLDPADGAAFDRVDRTGRVLSSNKQVWPQTEHVKACAARYEEYGSDLAELQRTLELCFSRHVDPVHHGWRDFFSREGKLLAPVMPAVTVYHIFLGLSEAMRVLEERRGRP